MKSPLCEECLKKKSLCDACSKKVSEENIGKGELNVLRFIYKLSNKNKRNKRRASSFMPVRRPALVSCPNCGGYKLSHFVCPHCGWYKGRAVISIILS